jgi:hypothetical protein
MFALLQDPVGLVNPEQWLQFGALGLLALVLVGVGIAAFVIIRDVAKAIVARVAETGRFSEELARTALVRTQDVAERAVESQVQLASVIKKSTEVIERLQMSINEADSRHSTDHLDIRRDIARLDGRLGGGPHADH